MRRRGFPPVAIRRFCDAIGVAKANSLVDIALLEHLVREELNQHASRTLAVLRPMKVVLVNYPEGESEELDAVNNPEDPDAGTRKVPFSRELYIESSDFHEDPPKKYFRLAPGREVRLRWGYFIKCVDVVKDDKGEITEIHCTYDPETRGGQAPDGRKVRGTIHWVSAAHALNAEVRLYDHLFTQPDPEDAAQEAGFKSNLNPESLEVLTGCKLEPSLVHAQSNQPVQFERLGYFCVDSADSTPDHLVFNRTVTLRDSWAKIQKAQAGS
jgi:glutaminyl-tRNA synthetase